MRVLVTGVNGQLGHDVANELEKRGHVAIRTTSASMNITDAELVLHTISMAAPDAVIHCAAWTAVDKAEEKENVSKVFAINAAGTRNVAEACRAVDAKMVYMSTDYVFNGNGTAPWKPDCKDYAPLSVYGKSKLEGELAVADTLDKYYIVRTAWVFGLNGSNFVKTMLKLSESHDAIRVVNDQIGTPTYTRDLARLLVDMVWTNKYGYYHATNEGGYTSWAEFAKEIFRLAGKAAVVVPVTSQEYGLSKAVRPFNSRLDKSKLSVNGFIQLPSWQDALTRYLEELKNGTD